MPLPTKIGLRANTREFETLAEIGPVFDSDDAIPAALLAAVKNEEDLQSAIPERTNIERESKLSRPNEQLIEPHPAIIVNTEN